MTTTTPTRAHVLDGLRRLVVIALALAFGALAAHTFAVASSLVGASSITLPGLALRYAPTELPWALRLRWLGGAVVLAGSAIVLVRLAFGGPAREAADSWFELSTGGHTVFGTSRVRVAREAMQALVAHAAESVADVVEARSSLSLHRRGFQIRCGVLVRPDAELPALVPELRRAIRDAVHHHTGIEVVDVVIDARLEAPSNALPR